MIGNLSYKLIIYSLYVLQNPSGDICFSGGFLGPDGTNRYLGKWCKRGLNKESNTGNLIAVGADGRGGRVKVLRSLSQSSLVGSCTHCFCLIYFCTLLKHSYYLSV